MQCSPTMDVDLLKPFHALVDYPPAPDRCPTWGRRVSTRWSCCSKEIRWVLHYLVQWRGHTSADNKWLLAEELAHCPELVAKYYAATPSRLRARQTASALAVPAGVAAATAPPRAAGLPVGPEGMGSWPTCWARGQSQP